VTRGVFLGVLCAVVLWSRVFVSFDAVRLKVVKEAQVAAQGELRVTLPASPRFQRLVAPVVLITTLRNPGAQPATLAVSLDGARVGTVTLAPGDDRRVDIVVPNGRTVRGGEVLTFSARDEASDTAHANTAWSLEYLEVANHHGSSRSVFPFYIVPHATQAYDPPGLLLIVCVSLGIVFFAARGESMPRTRTRRIAHNAWVVLVVLVLLTVLASGAWSPFALLLSPRAFLLCAVALTWPGIVRSYREISGVLARRAAWAPRTLDAAAVALAVGLFYVLVVQALLPGFDRNYSGFLQVGRSFVDRVPFLKDRPDLKSQLFVGSQTGYDGQFVYYIAFDPFLRALQNPVSYRDVVDAPPYRYGRIGFSLLTKLFSGDRPERYPQTMVWTILAATVVGAFLLARIAQHHGHSALWGLAYVLVPGFVQSLHSALPEPIAAAGLLGGYWLMLRGRAGWAAALFAASLLMRETGVILVVALAASKVWAERDRRGAAVIASAALPLFAWRTYVAWRLFPDFGWHGFFFNPENLGVPFKGFVDLWRVIQRGEYLPSVPAAATGGTFYPPLLIAALVVSVYLLWQRRDGLAAAIVGYACVAVSLNYTAIWANVANGERGTYELLLLLLVAAVSTGQVMRHTRVVLGAFLVCLSLYLWLASADAATVKYVVMSSSLMQSSRID
jgi:hypothetical protein